MLKAYSKYALHDERNHYPDEIATRTLDEHAAKLKSAHHLAPLTGEAARDRGAGVPYQCSCPYYWHYRKCKHSFAKAIKDGTVAIPAQYRIDKIGQTRKAGRPKKARTGEALAEKNTD